MIGRHGFSWLEHRLCHPAHRVDLLTLLDLWQHDDAVALCRRPRHLEDAPDLSLRIRGALGNMLDRAIPPASTRSDPFRRPDAHRMLFAWKAPTYGDLQVAQPYTVLSDVRGDLVEIRVRLFGMAGWHAPAVLDALIEALNGGVSLKNHGIRVPFDLLEARTERFSGAARAWQRDGSAVGLDLRTPLVIRTGQRIQIGPEALMRAMIRRVETLAPWMHCALEIDHTGLDVSARRFKYSMLDIHPENWSRTTRRDPGRAKPIYGYAGTVRIEGDLREWAPIIDLAQFTSIGGETSLGMGALRPTFLP